MNFVDDLYRYEGERAESKIVQLRNILFVPPVQYIYVFRKIQNSKCSLTRLFFFCLLRFLQYLYNIQIPYQTKIDKGLRILHWGTIVVNPDTVIGKNFNIAQGCLIGFAHGKHKGIPTIGNNVVMGANSIIVGGVKIGDDVLIAPGAFVNFDVPDNCVVVGNPGKIIQKDSSPTEKYEIYRV